MTSLRRSRRRTGGDPRADAELVEAARSGDREAFVAVVRRHDGRMRALAAKLLGGDRDAVDDALQEAYVRAYRSLASFRRDAEFPTWLYRIAYNACVDELRRAGRRPAPVDTGDTVWDRPAAASGPDAVVSAADEADRALAALPPEQRGALVLIDGEGFDHESAARILGVPPGTVASRLSRARATARRLIERDVS